jgi:metal-sulfur cluster biosynthetic enzyme
MQGSEENKLNNRDYDAIGSDEINLADKVRSNLRRVIDPEIGINIVDLGLVYDIDVNEENDVQVIMTLTAPNCPFGEMIMMETEFAVRSLKEANLIKITLTFDPPWNPDIHVSDEAKYQMGIL